jgi:hypothetical protein
MKTLTIELRFAEGLVKRPAVAEDCRKMIVG